MKHFTFKKATGRIRFQRCVMLLCALGIVITVPIHAQKKPKDVRKYSVSSYVPSGYAQVGNTMLYYQQTTSSIDIQGCFNGLYYGSTFSNYGYRLAMQVNNESVTSVDCLNGTTVNNVTCNTSIEQQGELAKICYTVTNANNEDVLVSLGTHADVMIGNNDRAPISKRIDTMGNTYGVTMKDGDGAQLCVLFGSGLAGVTSINDFWFGHYSLNRDLSQMVGNYASGSDYMQENGSYDSGMGWCWKNRTIPANTTVVFSYLIGVGEVNLEPNSTFEATPDDAEGWNDLSRSHKLTLEGTYESPAGLDGVIEYAVEDSEEWQPLTKMIPSGSTFNDTIVVRFDPTRQKHVIRFRTKDNVGNTALLPSIEYVDVSFCQYSGVVDKTYTGDSIYQDVVCTDVADLAFTTGRYANNLNAGTASFCVEGVFPYTIGRKRMTFKIDPAPLTGDISLAIDSSLVYNGQQHTPECLFTNAIYSSLKEGVDYKLIYTDNINPGTATVTVKGIGNYTSELTKTFFIDKAPLRADLYSVTLPNADVSYDGVPHRAMAVTNNGVGEVTFTYTLHNDSSALAEAPKDEGHYDVYAEIADGTLYYGKPTEFVGTFSIYRMDEAEWQALGILFAELQQMGVTLPWNMTEGAKNVGSFKELKIREGHVVGISIAHKGLSGLFPASLAAFPKIEEIDLSGNKLKGDLSTAVAGIKMQNAAVFSHLKKLNISNNQYSGNVGLLANCISSLSSLNVSNNKFEDLYPAPPATLIDLDVSHQEMDRVVELNMSKLNLEDIGTKVPTILLYDKNSHSYSTTINLLCTKADLDTFNKYDTSEWAMQLQIANNQISIPYVSAQNAYYGETGDTLQVLNMTSNESTDGSRFKIKLLFSPGDANFVNGVDATDLQATILYAFGAYRNYPFNFTAANTYKDACINVQDVVCTVHILLNSNNESLAKAKHQYAHNALSQEPINAQARIFVRDGKIYLNSNIPVASLSLKAAGDVRWHFEAMGLQQSTHNSNVVAYSLNGTTIPNDEDVVIGEFTHIKMLSASLSDANAKAISVEFDDSMSTGINEASNSDMDNVEIYNVSGYRTKTLSNGVNIIRQDGKTRKIFKNK